LDDTTESLLDSMLYHGLASLLTAQLTGPNEQPIFDEQRNRAELAKWNTPISVTEIAFGIDWSLLVEFAGQSPVQMQAHLDRYLADILPKYVKNRRVHDLGAGALGWSFWLMEAGAEVFAYDRMYSNTESGVKHEVYPGQLYILGRAPAFIDMAGPDDVGFLAYPLNTTCDNFLRFYNRPGTLVVGAVNDGLSACGEPGLLIATLFRRPLDQSVGPHTHWGIFGELKVDIQEAKFLFRVYHMERELKNKNACLNFLETVIKLRGEKLTFMEYVNIAYAYPTADVCALLKLPTTKISARSEPLLAKCYLEYLEDSPLRTAILEEQLFLLRRNVP
jgi:hypothetical protein